ncbi:MAG: hypothetical protein ACO2O2_15515 [Acidilobaceae archaeon]
MEPEVWDGASDEEPLEATQTRECPGEVVVTPEGYRVCSATGEILEEIVISDEPERYFKEESKSIPRIGSPLTYTQHDMGIGVSLEPRRPSNPLKRAGNLVRKVKVTRVTKKDVCKVMVLQYANEVASALELPKSAREDVGFILQRYLAREKVNGDRERRCLVAAVILKVIERYNLDITQNEVLERLDVDQLCVWEAKNKLHEKGVLAEFVKTIYGERGQERLLGRVETYVAKIVSELKLGDEVRRTAMEFIRATQRNRKNLYGKRPETIAAAAVYLVARLYGYDHVNQDMVARVVKIKGSNVRKLYRYLMDGMVVLVPL